MKIVLQQKASKLKLHLGVNLKYEYGFLRARRAGCEF